MADTVSGDLVLELAGVQDADDSAIAAVDSGLVAFGDAVAKGAFGPAARAINRRHDRRPGVTWGLTVDALPPHAVTCLEGMLSFRLVDAPPNLSLSASLGGRQVFGRRVNPPGLGEEALPVRINAPRKITGSLEIVIKTAGAPQQDDVQALSRVVAAWQELVLGGYPPPEQPIGSSGIGSVTVRRITTNLILLGSDDFYASVAALQPLVTMIVQCVPALRIQSVTAE